MIMFKFNVLSQYVVLSVSSNTISKGSCSLLIWIELSAVPPDTTSMNSSNLACSRKGKYMDRYNTQYTLLLTRSLTHDQHYKQAVTPKCTPAK